MKKFLIAAVFVAAAASPSFAATTHHRHAVMPQQAAADSYAMMPTGNVVVQDGQVLGADPDPFIRGQLVREGDPGSLSN